jgi:hypothetical protein
LTDPLWLPGDPRPVDRRELAAGHLEPCERLRGEEPVRASIQTQ